MGHRSNIFGLFGGSKAPKASSAVAKAAEPVAVDPMPYFERAVALSRKIRSDHYVIHAPAKEGVGDAWYWITTFSRGGFDVSGL